VSKDQSYHAHRAIEERRRAMASADPKVRSIHLELAAKYAALAGANPHEPQEPFSEQLPPDEEQQASR
jgi:hypothetical protein